MMALLSSGLCCVIKIKCPYLRPNYYQYHIPDFVVEIMSTLKAIKSHLIGHMKTESITLAVISYEIHLT